MRGLKASSEEGEYPRAASSRGRAGLEGRGGGDAAPSHPLSQRLNELPLQRALAAPSPCAPVGAQCKETEESTFANMLYSVELREKPGSHLHWDRECLCPLHTHGQRTQREAGTLCHFQFVWRLTFNINIRKRLLKKYIKITFSFLHLSC